MAAGGGGGGDEHFEMLCADMPVNRAAVCGWLPKVSGVVQRGTRVRRPARLTWMAGAVERAAGWSLSQLGLPSPVLWPATYAWMAGIRVSDARLCLHSEQEGRGCVAGWLTSNESLAANARPARGPSALRSPAAVAARLAQALESICVRVEL
jgi:hypothetical protein